MLLCVVLTVSSFKVSQTTPIDNFFLLAVRKGADGAPPYDFYKPPVLSSMSSNIVATGARLSEVIGHRFAPWNGTMLLLM